MELFTVTGILAVVFFGLLAAFFSYKHEQVKKKSLEREREYAQKLFELEVLKTISDKIGYSLNLEDILETIATTVENLFDLTTISYLLVKDKTLYINTITKEPVGERYVQDVARIMTSAVYGIDDITRMYALKQTIQKDIVDHANLPFDSFEQSKKLQGSEARRASGSYTVPQSYFNVPLVINNQFVGLLTITSHMKNSYHEDDMSIFYKIVNLAQKAVGQLEEVIATEKGKVDSLLLSLPAGAMMFLVDKNGLKLSTINNAAKSFLRVGDAPDTATVLTAFGGLNIGERLAQVLQTKKAEFTGDVSLNGRYFKIYINPVLFYTTRELIGVSVTLQDITPEKQLASLREDFTHMVVHELRAPLTSIKGAAELMSQKTISEQDRSKMLHIIHDSSERMLQDIANLLDAAKIENGRFTIMREQADIAEAVQKRVEALEILAQEKQLTLSVRIPNNLPHFEFDPVRIGQVITNLLSNSIKFTPSGGQISVSVAQEGPNLRVSVTDTGIGIGRDKMGLLFTKFEQAGSTAQGSGLGLYIVKGIIEAHGGTIGIESEEGRGTKITFTLPIENPQTGRRAPQFTFKPVEKMVN